MRIRPEDREHQLAMLNPLLEHKTRQFGSGNCSMEGSMTARMIAVSNPVWGTSDMATLCNNIDTSFLSRMLVWYLDKNHVKGVHSRDLKCDSSFKIENNHFVSMVDYAHTFQSEFDRHRIKETVDKNGELINDNQNTDDEFARVREVYNARYLHHALCLIDGIIKTRCFCSGDTRFKAKTADYALFEHIWQIMVINWGIYHQFNKKGQNTITAEKVT
jgi:hypothetical protein